MRISSGVESSHSGPARVAALPADGIRVDFQRLQTLVAELNRVVGQLTARAVGVDVGEPELAQALSHAEDDWRRHRRDLAGFLDGAAAALTSGLAEYAQAEQAISRAAQVGSQRR